MDADLSHLCALTKDERAELEDIDFSLGAYGWPQAFELIERIIAVRLSAAWADGYGMAQRHHIEGEA
jgi:hypothetical protein